MRTTACLPIVVLLLCMVSENSLLAEESLQIGGTGAALGTMQQLANAYLETHPGTAVEILPSLSSGGGIKALIAGQIDIALSARSARGDELDHALKIIPYASTPVALVTPVANSIDSIASVTVLEIITGVQTEWPDGTPIGLVLRPSHSSETQTLIDMHQGIADVLDSARRRPGVPVANTVGEAADLIQGHQGGLGTTSLNVILSEKRPLKVLKLDGVEPSVEAVRTGRYKFVKSFYMIVQQTPGEVVQEFIDFVRSAEGESILNRTGHIVVKDTN